MALGNTPRRETNIAVEASKSYVLGLHFVQQSENESDAPFPLDLTGCEVRFVMAEPPQRGNTEVLTLLAVIDQPTTGLAQLRFQASDLSIESTSYAYDVTLIPPSGYSTPILKGYVEVGSNTDLYDANVYTELNITSDITVEVVGHDTVTIIIERVDGMFLVVTELIENFTADMAVQVAAATDAAQSALVSSNEAEGFADEMRVWLNNAGFPFWKGTQAEFATVIQKPEVLYLITDEAVL